MNKYYVSFTTRDCDFVGGKAFHEKYSERGQIIKNEKCKKNGIIPVSWNPESLKNTDFYEKNKDIFSKSRGYGYWLWKPFIIEEALKESSNGDFIFYMDAGSSYPFPNLFEKYINLCRDNNGFFFVNSHYQNKFFIKRDVYHYMNFDNQNAYDSLQINACFIVFMKNEKTLSFVKEWKEFCEDRRLITDDINTCGLDDLPEFQDHRHDQAILSILALKYGIEKSKFYLEDIK